MNLTLDTNNSLSMKGSGKVIIKRSIVIVGSGTKLPVEITADFSKVPQELHESYYQSLVYNYNNTDVWNNTKQEPKEPRKEKSNIDKIVDIIKQTFITRHNALSK